MVKMAFILRGPLLVFLLIISTATYAQNELTQTVRGRILDAVTSAPIAAASVSLSGKNDKIASDTEGSFRFEKTPVGRYDITAFCVGYQQVTLNNIVVESGKETVLDIRLTASNTLLESFEVSSSTPILSKLGLAQSINMETLQRVPANFNDVARMLTNVAGVASESDAANHISVRGLSPNALQWYLEGAEIVNPNHLSNAATSGDRATQNGGGVSIFSTQVLERADFYKGTVPTDAGNALGAMIDVRFRNGNDEKKETTLGIGLVGLDVATEGSFSKKSKASYLVNYRYSTVGLLSKLGVPLGDEASAFQDFSFKLHFPTQKSGVFDVFGMGGISENVFVHKKRDKWETQKDSQDITFKNRMGAIGVSHYARVGKKNLWETVAVLSGLDNSRLAVGFNSFELPVNINDFNSIHRKFYVRSRVNFNLKKNILVAGVVVKNEYINDLDIYKTASQTWQAVVNGQGIFYMPFADFSGTFGEKWVYSVGLRANYFSFTNKLSVEPTANIRRNLRENESIKLSYSRQSQMLTPSQYLNANKTRKEGFIKSDNLNLTYTNQLAKDIHFSATAFAQFYKDIFVVDPQFPPQDFWSILDGFSSEYGYGGMAGTAQSVGFEGVMSEKTSKGWYWEVGLTLFDATYTEPKPFAKPRALAYNSRYIFNAYFGKEWTLGSRKNKFLGFGSRTILRGGHYYREYNSFSLITKQVAPYFRTDLNVYFKKNRRKSSSIVQLDIQNVTNKNNEQYYYYDSFLNRETPQYQLGLLPNLSYRISF
jgi:hypothetical protein